MSKKRFLSIVLSAVMILSLAYNAQGDIVA